MPLKVVELKIVYQKSCTSDLRLGIWYHAALICASDICGYISWFHFQTNIYLVEKFESLEKMKYPSA